MSHFSRDQNLLHIMSDDHKHPEEEPSQTLLCAHATCPRVGQDLTLMPNRKFQISPSRSNRAVAIQGKIKHRWRACATQILTRACLGALLVQLGTMSELGTFTSILR